MSLGGLASCAVGNEGEATAGLAVPADYRVAFERINARAYGSELGPFDINLFVDDPAHAGDYAKIHPETSGSRVTIAVGTAIVREVLDLDHQVTKLTLMIKGPTGYDPRIGDWWFAVTDPAGMPLPDDRGVPQVGQLTACHGCHLPRASDDYLFGVPAVDVTSAL
ncbi:MAG: hypothetical protein NT062_03555 [Proteobacteria bacterium]|nr:hypothetical protein [Pseudomonadota bacterium]